MSEFASPIVLAPKSSVPYVRFCGNYQETNMYLSAGHQYIPMVEHELHKIIKYRIFLDMDIKNGWDMRGIFDSFSKVNEWDAVCSNGLWYGERAYDMFAFRNGEVEYGDADFWKKTWQGGWKYYSPGSELVKVDSCFGGMAFYKREAIRGCSYASWDADCEHVAFNKCVREKNHGRILMNPSQVIRYFTLDWLF